MQIYGYYRTYWKLQFHHTKQLAVATFLCLWSLRNLQLVGATSPLQHAQRLARAPGSRAQEMECYQHG